jgi:hypothetical protein
LAIHLLQPALSPHPSPLSFALLASLRSSLPLSMSCLSVPLSLCLCLSCSLFFAAHLLFLVGSDTAGADPVRATDAAPRYLTMLGAMSALGVPCSPLKRVARSTKRCSQPPPRLVDEYRKVLAFPGNLPSNNRLLLLHTAPYSGL